MLSTFAIKWREDDMQSSCSFLLPHKVNHLSIYQCSNEASVFDIDIHSIENLGLRRATRLYHFFGKAMAKVLFFLD